MRVGIFGGSFDPIHLGHLILAESCLEQARLDEIIFMPSNMAPHKREGAFATDRQRIEMIDLAIGGHPGFRRSSMEIDRDGVSFTVDTLSELTGERPDDELFFLMGADSLEQFHTWREPEQILKLATPLIVGRPGANTVDLDKLTAFANEERIKYFKELSVESPLIDISSTDIRRRASSELSIRFLVPRPVEKYIETQNIYR